MFCLAAFCIDHRFDVCKPFSARFCENFHHFLTTNIHHFNFCIVRCHHFVSLCGKIFTFQTAPYCSACLLNKKLNHALSNHIFELICHLNTKVSFDNLLIVFVFYSLLKKTELLCISFLMGCTQILFYPYQTRYSFFDLGIYIL